MIRNINLTFEKFLKSRNLIPKGDDFSFNETSVKSLDFRKESKYPCVSQEVMCRGPSQSEDLSTITKYVKSSPIPLLC